MIFVWIATALIIGAFGQGRKIGFVGGFVASLLLSPYVGAFVIFRSKTLEQLAQERAARAAAAPPPPVKAAPTPAPRPGAADELKKLADLKDAGIITQEEFDLQKAKLFG